MKAEDIELARQLLKNRQGWKRQYDIVSTAKEVTIQVGGPDPFDDKVMVTLELDGDFAAEARKRALDSVASNVRDTEEKLKALGVEF